MSVALVAGTRPAFVVANTGARGSRVLSRVRGHHGRQPRRFEIAKRVRAGENLGSSEDAPPTTTGPAGDAVDLVAEGLQETLVHARDHGHGDETHETHEEHSHDHDHDHEESSVTTEHGSALWRDFSLAVTGDWGGCCVEFDAVGNALDIPIRFVHGVGRVPTQNMPFADTQLDWMTKTSVAQGVDGVTFAAKRAMPQIGNEDAISSCGGAEWGEHVAFVEDAPITVLRGKNSDQTILPNGSFSAGTRVLPFVAGEVTTAQHCLAHPLEGSKRVRVIHRVTRIENTWQTCGIEVWMEQRGEAGNPECVSPFSGAEKLSANDLLVGAREFSYLPNRSAAYFLMWDDETYSTDLEKSHSKSFFTLLADAGEAEDLTYWEGDDGEVYETVSETAGEVSVAVTETATASASIETRGSKILNGLTLLPNNLWVFAGVARGHDVGVGSGGEEGQLVLECGWCPEGNGGGWRTVSTRYRQAFPNHHIPFPWLPARN